MGHRVQHEVAALLTQTRRRVRELSVSVPGTVSGSRIVQASNLEWRDVDLAHLAADLPLLAGNDATLAGLAETRRGAAVGTDVVLHLKIDVGLGGILVVDGIPMTGATGAGGEFGHLPFGDPRRRCLCGAWGCWDNAVLPPAKINIGEVGRGGRCDSCGVRGGATCREGLLPVTQ